MAYKNKLDGNTFLDQYPYTLQCHGCKNLITRDYKPYCDVYGSFQSVSEAQDYWLGKKDCPSYEGDTNE